MIAGSIQPSSGSCLAFILQLEGKLGLQGTAKAGAEMLHVATVKKALLFSTKLLIPRFAKMLKKHRNTE